MESWFRETEMSRIQARNAVFNVFQHQYKDHKQLKNIINDIINDKVEMFNYKSYWKFQHMDFKTKVKERIEYCNKKIKLN
jgi:hypothetical protein